MNSHFHIALGDVLKQKINIYYMYHKNIMFLKMFKLLGKVTSKIEQIKIGENSCTKIEVIAFALGWPGL